MKLSPAANKLLVHFAEMRNALQHALAALLVVNAAGHSADGRRVVEAIRLCSEALNRTKEHDKGKDN